MNYLLDSSAWLVHLLGEPGVQEVTRLFDERNSRVGISALSIPEVFGRMRSMGRSAHWPEVWEVYAMLFSDVFPADEAVALRAIELRAATEKRLPTLDALIAATAATQGLVLVHRDPHMGAIPETEVLQVQLPER